MKFHRKCGGIFSSSLREKLKSTNKCEAKNKVEKSFKKIQKSC